MCNEKGIMVGFIGYDLVGNAFNCKYPPNLKLNGYTFGGYATPNQQTFFYDFCILQYGVAFSFEEDIYEAEFSDNGPILLNRETNEFQGPFDDAVQLLEEAIVGGKKMITILDKLKNVALH